MSDLLIAMIPLVVGSALVPAQIILITLLLRSPTGRLASLAMVAGMTTVRVVQGVVFGLILGESEEATTGDGPSLVVAVVLLVAAALFYVLAAKYFLSTPDEDAPPPKWMAVVDSIGPGKGFLVGAGLMLIGLKFWVFTLGAISAIGEAALGQTASIVAFLVYVVLAQGILLAMIGMAYLVPARAASVLARLSEFMTRNNRTIMIALGLVFGTWLLLKSLQEFGLF